MKDEIKEILDNLKEAKEKEAFFYTLTSNEVHDLLDYITNLKKEIRINNDLIPYFKNKEKSLKKEITNLQNKIKQYEDPEDLTLFYMWLDEKAKDKMKQLQEENERLKDLCDKYEVEHNTTFKLWKGKLKETMDETLIQKQHDRIKELEQINEEHRKLNGELREKNERLREENKHIFANVNDDQLLRSNAMNYAEAQDYKTRNEKAVEYIKEDMYVEPKELYGLVDGEHLLNILQGSDNSE